MNTRFMRLNIVEQPCKTYEYELVLSPDEIAETLDNFKKSNYFLADPWQVEWKYIPASVQVNIYPARQKPMSDEEIKDVWEETKNLCTIEDKVETTPIDANRHILESKSRCSDMEFKPVTNESSKNI
jgi:hypothetical protein